MNMMLVNQLFIDTHKNNKISKQLKKPLDKLKYLINDTKDILIDTDGNPFDLYFDHKCLLCGSSGKLKHSNYGNHINKYKTIVRFNIAPTEGYEKFVGDRTTIRFIRGPTLRRKILPVKKNRKYLNDSDYIIIVGRFKKFKSKSKVLFINPKFLERLNLIFKASTGFVGFIIMHMLSEKLDLIGFMNLGYVKRNCGFHYWEKLNGKQNKMIGSDNLCHPMNTESRLIKKMLNGIILY